MRTREVASTPFTIAGSRKRARCYGCSWHRNRGVTVCANDLLESVSVVDTRILEEIERTVLTPAARRFVVASAEKALHRDTASTAAVGEELQRALARVEKEIENLLRAIETGAAPDALVKRLGEREHERATLQAELVVTQSRGQVSDLDTQRIRRALADGLSRLGDVLASDPTAARRALVRLLAGKVRFTPIELPTGERTYRFEAKLALGQIASLVRQNDVGVPEGVRTLLFPRFRLLALVKRVA